jgi:hypothetical protein
MKSPDVYIDLQISPLHMLDQLDVDANVVVVMTFLQIGLVF